MDLHSIDEFVIVGSGCDEAVDEHEAQDQRDRRWPPRTRPRRPRKLSHVVAPPDDNKLYSIIHNGKNFTNMVKCRGGLMGIELI